MILARNSTTTFSIESQPWDNQVCNYKLHGGLSLALLPILWFVVLLKWWPRNILNGVSIRIHRGDFLTAMTANIISFVSVMVLLTFFSDQKITGGLFGLTGARPALALGCPDYSSMSWDTMTWYILPLYLIDLSLFIFLRRTTKPPQVSGTPVSRPKELLAPLFTTFTIITAVAHIGVLLLAISDSGL